MIILPDDLDADLTDEDRKYLRLKWGKAYRPEEWVALEQLYNDMLASYDIQSAGHIDILKKCCKTSLKADQLLDIGDVEGAQKMVRMYDMLMKAGKFTAAQNKGESGEAVGRGRQDREDREDGRTPLCGRSRCQGPHCRLL